MPTHEDIIIDTEDVAPHYELFYISQLSSLYNNYHSQFQNFNDPPLCIDVQSAPENSYKLVAFAA